MVVLKRSTGLSHYSLGCIEALILVQVGKHCQEQRGVYEDQHRLSKQDAPQNPSQNPATVSTAPELMALLPIYVSWGNIAHGKRVL
jgi:hypothetical protein